MSEAGPVRGGGAQGKGGRGVGRQGDLVRDTYVNYDVANAVVSQHLVRKSSRSAIPKGTSGPLGHAVQYAPCRRGRVPSGDESTLGKLPGLCHVSSPILTDCQAPFKYRHHCPEQDGRGSGHDMSPQRLHSPERICGVQRLLGISGLTCFKVYAAAGPSKDCTCCSY